MSLHDGVVYACCMFLYQHVLLLVNIFVHVSDHLDVVQCLLCSGADQAVRMGIPATTTPLSLAQDLGHTDIVCVLEKLTEDKE